MNHLSAPIIAERFALMSKPADEAHYRDAVVGSIMTVRCVVIMRKHGLFLRLCVYKLMKSVQGDYLLMGN